MDTRIIIDPPRSGCWNMAADQLILESTDAGGPITLRIYQWSEPTLSIGYFQSIASREDHPASFALDFVRRATGGGAIVHDQEVTYSLTVPDVRCGLGESSMLYQLVHQAIISVLAAFGVVAERYGEREQCATSSNKICADPWLCFQRRTSEDIISSGYKVAGSAQRRGKQAVLQHGSILLSASPSAPELPGIAEVTGRVLNQSEFSGLLASVILNRFSGSNSQYLWAEIEQKAIETLIETRYATMEWQMKR